MTEWPTPASTLSQITVMGLEPRVQLNVAGRSKNIFVNTRATYSVLISYSGNFFPQTCTILVVIGKVVTKRFTLAAGMDRHFCISFWWPLSVLPPYWEEIYLISWGPPLWWESVQPPELYNSLVATEELTVASPIVKPWEEKLNLQVWGQLLDELTELN